MKSGLYFISLNILLMSLVIPLKGTRGVSCFIAPGSSLEDKNEKIVAQLSQKIKNLEETLDRRGEIRLWNDPWGIIDWFSETPEDVIMKLSNMIYGRVHKIDRELIRKLRSGGNPIRDLLLLFENEDDQSKQYFFAVLGGAKPLWVLDAPLDPLTQQYLTKKEVREALANLGVVLTKKDGMITSIYHINAIRKVIHKNLRYIVREYQRLGKGSNFNKLGLKRDMSNEEIMIFIEKGSLVKELVPLWGLFFGYPTEAVKKYIAERQLGVDEDGYAILYDEEGVGLMDIAILFLDEQYILLKTFTQHACYKGLELASFKFILKARIAVNSVEYLIREMSNIDELGGDPIGLSL